MIPTETEPKKPITIGSLADRAAAMELASNDLWSELRKFSVAELKTWRPNQKAQKFVDALIVIRQLMGD